jgi:hypothetical protein
MKWKIGYITIEIGWKGWKITFDLRYLNSFGKQVVNRSKGNLQKAGKGGKLEESITFKVIEDADGFTVQFFMSSYGQYVDKGVSGTQKKRTFKNYKNKVVKSPYAYRNAKGHSQPPSKKRNSSKRCKW